LKRYIVDAKWWAKWCDYCNFDHDDILFNQLKNSNDHAMIGSAGAELIKNYLSTSSNKRFESTQLYTKPGRIENENLLA
jgi:hypothetical protein